MSWCRFVFSKNYTLRSVSLASQKVNSLSFGLCSCLLVVLLSAGRLSLYDCVSYWSLLMLILPVILSLSLSFSFSFSLNFPLPFSFLTSLTVLLSRNDLCDKMLWSWMDEWLEFCSYCMNSLYLMGFSFLFSWLFIFILAVVEKLLLYFMFSSLNNWFVYNNSGKLTHRVKFKPLFCISFNEL